MPMLDWLNRSASFQTAADVPTRVLRPHAAGSRFGDTDSAAGNLLVQCDNLQVLLPFYRGQMMLCAPAIDSHPAIRRWVHNLDYEPVHGFWPPTSFGRFYPDFVRELNDSGVFVAEYKEASQAPS